MATISAKSWDRYIDALRKLNTKATNRMLEKINEVGTDDREALEELIRYAYGIATRYGEGASALSAEMYDALAELSGKIVPPAVPAPTASYGDVAKAVYGTDLQSKNPQVMADSIGRLVKMAGVDTMQQNALRDGAEWAWIPRGDTCAFCIMLASNGWQRASKKAIKNGHAMHIHANCDCTYAIRFNSDVDVEGYNDGQEYRDMYYGAEGSTPEERINYMRRQFYAENKGIVGAESSIAEEFISGDQATGWFGSQRPPRELGKTNREEYERLLNEYRESQYYKWADGLSAEEIGAIADYSGDGYLGINGLLRHQVTQKMAENWNAFRNMSLDNAIKLLDKAIDKFDLKAPIKVYRTCENDVLEKIKVGSIFHDEGFGSTSVLSKKVASGNVVMEINVPKGRGYGAWISPMSGSVDEYEFLLQRGSNYKVKKIRKSGDDTIVELDLIGNDKGDWSYASREEVIERLKHLGVYNEADENAI